MVEEEPINFKKRPTNMGNETLSEGLPKKFEDTDTVRDVVI